MGTFFTDSVSRLVPGQSSKYMHWFGGTPSHRGIVPPGREHPVHLLYDLDLRDPQLALATRFPTLSRLPLLNALQYNCCDMVYRIKRDDAVQILSIDGLPGSKWMADHPYDNYPCAFPRISIVAEKVPPDQLALIERSITEDGSDTGELSRAEEASLRAIGYPFAQVGGRHFMWQTIPHWECPTSKCRFAGSRDDVGKEVFAVIWERPIPEFNLWSNDPSDKHIGSVEIIFSRCTGCGVIQSCNRCD